MSSAEGVYDGGTMPLNSFVGHEFEIREVANAKTGSCTSPDKVCHMGSFKVSEHDNMSE